MNRYTRFYINQSGDGEIGPAYKASFRVQRGHGIGSFFKGPFRFVKLLLYSGENALGKEDLKTSANILTDLLNKEPDHQVGQTLESRLDEAKDNLEHKIKKMEGSGLCLKRKRKRKKAHSHSKLRTVKDIFTTQ
jgi:hypothetical protein